MDIIVYCLFASRATLDSFLGNIHLGSLTAAAAINVIILLLGAVLILQRGGSFFWAKLWLPFIIVASFTSLWTPVKGDAFRVILVLLTYAMAFAIPFVVSTEFRRRAYLIEAIIISSVPTALWAVIEAIFFLENSGRIRSTFFHPNVFAFYLTVIIGLIYFLLASSTVQLTRRYRVAAVAYSFLLLLLLVLTECRSAWGGVGLILVVYAAFANRRFLLFIALLPGILLVPSVSARLSDLTQGQYQGTTQLGEDGINSYAWRQLMWSSALKDAADEPLLGKGLASFGPNSLLFFPLTDPNANYSQKGVGAHSVFIQTIYETGYIGFACYAGMFIATILNCLRYFRKDPKGCLMLSALIIAYAAENYSDNMLDYGAVNFYFWGSLAIIFANWHQRGNDLLTVKRLARKAPRTIWFSSSNMQEQNRFASRASGV